VQTETVSISFHSPPHIESNKLGHLDDQEESALTAADLAAILKWSKDISSDINLSAGNLCLLMKSLFIGINNTFPTALKRLTEIATGGISSTINELINYLKLETSGSENTCGMSIMRNEGVLSLFGQSQWLLLEQATILCRPA
jgi:hypothetical protein